MSKIILIGGAPTVGKSFIARNLSEELKLPWISTDIIRGMMSKITDKNTNPKIFYFANKELSAETYLSTHTPKQIVEEQNSESSEVWEGVRALIESDYVWNNYIIEGVAILPKFIDQLDLTAKSVKPIFLVDENEDRIRHVIHTRGLWDDANSYPHKVKDVEVEWVKLFNEYIKSESAKFGFPVYNIEKREQFIITLTKEIREWIKIDDER